MFQTYRELRARGWTCWKVEPHELGLLMLCPLTDFDNVPKGSMYNIYEEIGDFVMTPEPVVKGVNEIDKDTRGGLMAYGIFVEPPPQWSLVVTINKIIEALKIRQE